MSNETVQELLNLGLSYGAAIRLSELVSEGVDQAAIDASVAAAVSALKGDAGAALDTLGELSDALGDDASYATTITNALASKAATGHNHAGIYQPFDQDLTDIAALTTTSVGRSLLAIADAAAGRTILGAMLDPTTAHGDMISKVTSTTDHGLTASWSTTFGSNAANVGDGNAGTAWISQGRANEHQQTIVADLGIPKLVGSYRMLKSTGNSGTVSYKIQSSDDGSSWTDRLSVGSSNAIADTGVVALTTPATARYWRFYNSVPDGGNGQLEVYQFSLYSSGSSLTRVPTTDYGRTLLNLADAAALAASAHAGKINFSAIIASAIDADQNNWLPTGLHTSAGIRFTGLTAARTLTGLDAGAEGDMLWLVNATAFTLNLAHDSASSTAANRFRSPNAATHAIRQQGGAKLVYTGTRWSVLAA